MVVSSNTWLRAAAGELSVDVLFSLIGYKMPSFLELILPLGLFLGILMSYGRLYLDSENDSTLGLWYEY